MERALRLEYEVRKAVLLEQHFVHGDWRIVKIYLRGKLQEIVVRRKISP